MPNTLKTTTKSEWSDTANSTTSPITANTTSLFPMKNILSLKTISANPKNTTTRPRRNNHEADSLLWRIQQLLCLLQAPQVPHNRQADEEKGVSQKTVLAS